MNPGGFVSFFFFFSERTIITSPWLILIWGCPILEGIQITFLDGRPSYLPAMWLVFQSLSNKRTASNQRCEAVGPLSAMHKVRLNNMSQAHRIPPQDQSEDPTGFQIAFCDVKGSRE